MPARTTLALLLTLGIAACDPPKPTGLMHDLGAGPDMAPPTEADVLAMRPYTPTVPASYDAAKTWPLLIVLAGYGGTGAVTSDYLGFTQLAADQGIFLVTPDGLLDDRFNNAWNPEVDQFPQFDVVYLQAIIHDLEARYSIDKSRVFVAGHSLGAHMAHRMACDASGDVAAIMAFAGQVSTDPADCAPAHAISVVDIHGTADRSIGYNGDVQNDPPDPSVPSAHDTIAVWARNDKCTGPIASTGTSYDLDSSLAGSETTVEAYGGCPTGIGVELWTIVGGAHHPPVTDGFAGAVWTWLGGHAR
jgi:polyhydroxybutyrate depolymerase